MKKANKEKEGTEAWRFRFMVNNTMMPTYTVDLGELKKLLTETGMGLSAGRISSILYDIEHLKVQEQGGKSVTFRCASGNDTDIVTVWRVPNAQVRQASTDPMFTVVIDGHIGDGDEARDLNETIDFIESKAEDLGFDKDALREIKMHVGRLPVNGSYDRDCDSEEFGYYNGTLCVTRIA